MTRFRLILILMGLIGLIAAIAIPSYVKSRQASRTSSCIGNLRGIDAAKEQANLKLKLPDGAQITINQIEPYLFKGTQSRWCSEDPHKSFKTSYSIEKIGERPICLINPASHTL